MATLGGGGGHLKIRNRLAVLRPLEANMILFNINTMILGSYHEGRRKGSKRGM